MHVHLCLEVGMGGTQTDALTHPAGVMGVSNLAEGPVSLKSSCRPACEAISPIYAAVVTATTVCTARAMGGRLPLMGLKGKRASVGFPQRVGAQCQGSRAAGCGDSSFGGVQLWGHSAVGAPMLCGRKRVGRLKPNAGAVKMAFWSLRSLVVGPLGQCTSRI